MMLIRRWSRIILVTLLVLVITSSGAFTGCGKKTIVPPVFSNIDNQILQSASTKYLELKTSSSPDAARITLVNSLNSQNGVANANLGVDGTTIFINYTDGDMAAVDTYDDSATETSNVPTSSFPLTSYCSEAGLAATDVNQNQLELISFKNSSMSEIHKPDSSDFTTTLGKETTSARNQDINTQLSTTTTVTPITTTTSAGDKGLIINPASTTTSTPVITTTSNPATASNTTKTGIMSKKVLILSPISDLFAPMKCRDSFLEYGWNPADVTLKMTSYSSTAESTTTSAEDKNLIINPVTTTTTTATTTPYINPNALLINPEDFFNLSGYGVIIINAHGCYLDNFNENSIYLQAGTVTKEKFDSNNGNNDYRHWKDAKQLLIESCPGTASSDNAYQVLIRGDLLRSKMSQLSASYVEMATCWGSKFSSIFLDKGAKSFISWDNHANEYYADANQVRMIGHMLEGMSVNDAYQNSSIVKQYTISAGEINVTKSLIINPISGPNVVNYFNYSNIDPHSIFFPAWVNLKVPVLPVGTSRLKVDIYDAGKNLYVTEDKALAAGQTSMKIDNFGDNCFPPGPCSVVTSALDSKGSILLANEAQFTLHVGANDLTISSSEYQYSISGSQDPKASFNFSRSGGIWLYIKLNGQFLVSGTWSSGALNFNAQPGDELEIMVVGNPGEIFAPDIFSASLGPLWFTSWVTGDQVKLTDGGNFKQYFGDGDTVVLDQKFIIPGAKPSTTTTTVPSSTTVPSTTQTPVTSTPSTTPTPTTSPSGTVVPSTTTSPTGTKAKLGELAYDDGAEDIWLSAGGTNKLGFVTRFTPDAPFVVNKIRIYSYMPTTPTPGSQFTVKITDGNLNPIWSVSLPFTLFTTQASWLAVDVPNISTKGEFCVEVYAPSLGEGLGPYVGVDQSSANTHSEMISNFQVTQWVAQIPKETANFMIRAYSPDSTGIISGIPHLTLSAPNISGAKVMINGMVTPGTTNTSITKIAWDWGEGTVEERWFPADHTYSKSGQYVVKVTAYQSDGITTTKSVTVTVQP